MIGRVAASRAVEDRFLELVTTSSRLVTKKHSNMTELLRMSIGNFTVQALSYMMLRNRGISVDFSDESRRTHDFR